MWRKHNIYPIFHCVSTVEKETSLISNSRWLEWMCASPICHSLDSAAVSLMLLFCLLEPFPILSTVLSLITSVVSLSFVRLWLGHPHRRRKFVTWSQAFLFYCQQMGVFEVVSWLKGEQISKRKHLEALMISGCWSILIAVVEMKEVSTILLLVTGAYTVT